MVDGFNYQRIRNGRTFAIGLASGCFVWMAWNWFPGLPHFDDHHLSLLVFFLSVEASLGLSAYGAVAERWQREAEAWQAAVDKRDAEQADILRHVRVIAERQADTMQVIHDHIVAKAVPGHVAADPAASASVGRPDDAA